MGEKIALLALLILSLVLGLLVTRHQSAKLDAMAERLENAQKETAAARAEIERLKQIQARQGDAEKVYFERANDGAKNYAEKIKGITDDGSACNWLDQSLPDSLRAQFGCADRDGGDGNTPTDPIDSMLKTTSRINANQ